MECNPDSDADVRRCPPAKLNETRPTHKVSRHSFPRHSVRLGERSRLGRVRSCLAASPLNSQGLCLKLLASNSSMFLVTYVLSAPIARLQTRLDLACDEVWHVYEAACVFGEVAVFKVPDQFAFKVSLIARRGEVSFRRRMLDCNPIFEPQDKPPKRRLMR